jgi:glycosyltransferase involved in cell wall biosynthesis
MSNEPKLRVMLISVVPPRNDCGVRIVMHRHLVERSPFELHVASNADFADDLLIHTKLQLPWLVQKLRKSRLGPWLRRWVQDYENLMWPMVRCRALEQVVDEFRPEVILTLAETGVCHLAAKVAKRRGIPLAVLFLDWFPIMEGHYGHRCTRCLLSGRFRDLYKQCDLAICTSDGMKEVLGPHPNSHVVYPMPGRRLVAGEAYPKRSGRFRLVYVGAAERFYGRMLRRLARAIQGKTDLELLIVGPCGDWPVDEREAASAAGITLGFLPPDEAAKVMAGADALLVVMSFEKDNELFMRTSFTTKWLDYAAYGKPVILWGPEYCTPSRLARREGAAVVVDTPDPAGVLKAVLDLQSDTGKYKSHSEASLRLSRNYFNPDRLQEILVTEIRNLCHG